MCSRLCWMSSENVRTFVTRMKEYRSNIFFVNVFLLRTFALNKWYYYCWHVNLCRLLVFPTLTGGSIYVWAVEGSNTPDIYVSNPPPNPATFVRLSFINPDILHAENIFANLFEEMSLVRIKHAYECCNIWSVLSQWNVYFMHAY